MSEERYVSRDVHELAIALSKVTSAVTALTNNVQIMAEMLSATEKLRRSQEAAILMLVGFLEKSENVSSSDAKLVMGALNGDSE